MVHSPVHLSRWLALVQQMFHAFEFGCGSVIKMKASEISQRNEVIVIKVTSL